MAAGFSMLLAKLAALVGWFGDLAVAVFVALWDFCRDIPAWIFEQVLSVASAALNGIDLSGITGNLQGFGSIPANVMLVMSAIGLSQALAMIAAALTIRFTLQLIPFTRLGS